MDSFLFRHTTSAEGTAGILSVPSASWCCHVLELPWRDNMANMSCIPRGVYPMRLRQSPRFGLEYEVCDVPERSYILFHSGNYAGNTERGYRSHSHGCLLPGKRAGRLAGQRAVLTSRTTVRRLMTILGGVSATLHISGVCG